VTGPAVAAGIRTVTATAPAKINLCLGVGPVRADGFHPLATVYQAVGLLDAVTVGPAPETTVTVTGADRIDLSGVPTDHTNIAARAAGLLAAHHGLDAPVRIAIHKGIPVAGGLAGGSADAAATLVACDALWQTRTPLPELLALAGRLGSDVPFCVLGGTASGSGHGELVAPVPTRGEHWWAVLESADGLSTPRVYAEFDQVHAGRPVPEPRVPTALLDALAAGDVPALGAALSNDLQEATLRLRPELGRSLALGREAGAHGALLSGSGPTCVFLCADEQHAHEVAGVLGAHGLGHVSTAPAPVAGARVVEVAG
jgi:4-diphosphocytidyl-2-C-methyl-D-erythritol kinase